MTINEMMDLISKASFHMGAGDIKELEITFELISDPGVIETGTYEPEQPPAEDPENGST